MARSTWAVLLVVIAVAAVLLLGAPVRDAALESIYWVEGRGAAGVLFVIFLYFPMAVFGMPVSWITVAAGALYGPWWAVAIATFSANAAANIAFVIGRRVGRERFARWIANYPKLQILERAIAKDGFRIALYARLSPVSPYGILGYFFSVTSISHRAFAAATLFGKTPGNFFYAFAGAGARSAVEAASGGAQESKYYLYFLLFGALATGLLVFALARIAKRALADAEDATSKL
ncbi:MAG: TVP38/TMEM64 family protein [Planctomycetota bacterium]